MSIKLEKFTGNYSANVAIAGTADLFTITVPCRSKLRLLSFGNYTDTLAAWTFIFWEFLNNGHGMSPYERVLDQIGFGPQRQPVQNLEVPGGSTFIIRANNPTAGIVAMGISIEYELEHEN